MTERGEGSRLLYRWGAMAARLEGMIAAQTPQKLEAVLNFGPFAPNSSAPFPMSHVKLQVPEFGVIEAYAAKLAERGYAPDATQRAAAGRLQTLYSELLDFKVARGSTLRKLISPPKPPRWVYFWGGVGRGKSFLMDCFYEAVPYQRKRRVHFHAFMQQIHRDLDALKGEPDPLAQVAKYLARDVRLLCFDEFHVSDIADAMILGRLVDALLAHGVVLVMTSNYPPDGLYPNGLQRINFLPTIELIKKNADVVEVDGGVDYRLRQLEQVDIYHVPPDAVAEQRLSEAFGQLSGGVGDSGKSGKGGKRAGEIEILGRSIKYRRQGPGIIWFDFAELCGGPRSQNDYLELARSFHTVVLSGIPVMTAAQASEARRFTWLVDVFYDHRVKLLATAAAAPNDLYVSGTHANEFFRTASRLIEMQSREYLALQHLD
jgi:cell division protein ZapE